MPEAVGAWIVLVLLVGLVVLSGWFLHGPKVDQPDTPLAQKEWLRRRRGLSRRTRWTLQRVNRRGGQASVELADLAACRAEAGIAALEVRPDTSALISSPTVRGAMGLGLAAMGAVSLLWDQSWWTAATLVPLVITGSGELTERWRTTRLRARLTRSFALNDALARRYLTRRPVPIQSVSVQPAPPRPDPAGR